MNAENATALVHNTMDYIRSRRQFRYCPIIVVIEAMDVTASHIKKAFYIDTKKNQRHGVLLLAEKGTTSQGIVVGVGKTRNNTTNMVTITKLFTSLNLIKYSSEFCAIFDDKRATEADTHGMKTFLASQLQNFRLQRSGSINGKKDGYGGSVADDLATTFIFLVY